MDYRSAPDFSDANTLIYGHHMKDGDMFGIVEKYKAQAFYEEHPIVFMYTAEKDYALEVFAGYLVSAIHPVFFEREFRDDEAYEVYLKSIRKLSFFQSEVEVTAEDRIVSLVTCTYDFEQARFVLAGKLVEFGGKTQ